MPDWTGHGRISEDGPWPGSDELTAAVRVAEDECKIAELERKVGQLTMESICSKGGRGWNAPGTPRATPS